MPHLQLPIELKVFGKIILKIYFSTENSMFEEFIMWIMYGEQGMFFQFSKNQWTLFEFCHRINSFQIKLKFVSLRYLQWKMFFCNVSCYPPYGLESYYNSKNNL